MALGGVQRLFLRPLCRSWTRFPFSTKWLENSRDQSELLQTTVIVQEGADIQELPIIVRRTNDVSIFCNEKDKDVTTSRPKYENCAKSTKVGLLDSKNTLKTLKKNSKYNENRIDIETDEGSTVLFTSDWEFLKDMGLEEVLSELESSYASKGLYSLLENAITEEINSRFALQVLRKIVNLERKQRYKYRRVTLGNAESREMVFQQLVDMIVTSRDSEMIVEGLSVLVRDKISPCRNAYRDKLTNEALVRATDGKLTIAQFIDVVKVLWAYKDIKYRKCIDILWSGLLNKQEDIHANDLVPLFKLLRYFHQSRRIVQSLLERKLNNHYHELTGSQMADILNFFRKGSHSSKVFTCASKWADLHITTASGYDLLEFIESLTAVKHNDSMLELALQNVMSPKSSWNKDSTIVVAIVNHCSCMQIRNTQILNNISQYFMDNVTYLPSALVAQILVLFGQMDYQPSEKKEYWMKIEELLDAKFAELQPEEVLNVLLSCAYVEKYMLSFINKIFSPLFLEKMHSHKKPEFVKELRNKLHLLDTSMTIECDSYKGPILPLDPKIRPILSDPRIKRAINKVYVQLTHLAGGKDNVSRNVTLGKLSASELYTLDALIHKKPMSASTLKLNLINERNENTAVLVILPHHYCWKSNKLIGQQVMRMRHLRKLGFRVMTLNLDPLLKLKDDSTELSNYVTERYEAAESAF